MNQILDLQFPKCMSGNCNKPATYVGELGSNKKPLFSKTCALHYANFNIVVNRQLELSL
jgi:hypothetical protein